jgi:polyisoprenoid-binding protein YceI
MNRTLLSLLLAAAVAVPALAAPSTASADTFVMDPNHTFIGFKIRHLGVSWVRGEFKKFRGTIVWDPADPDTIEIDVSIDIKSLTTDNKMRDDHLKSGDFFKAKEFPAMTYKSKKSWRDGDELVVLGDLTIRDVTLEVEMRIMGPSDEIKDPFSATIKRGASATATIEDRMAFGLEWGKLTEAGGLVVGKEVIIEIEAELNKKK